MWDLCLDSFFCTHRCPAAPVPICWKNCLFCCIFSFVKDQLLIFTWGYFWVLFSVAPTYLYIISSILHYIDYYSFIICPLLKIRLSSFLMLSYVASLYILDIWFKSIVSFCRLTLILLIFLCCFLLFFSLMCPICLVLLLLPCFWDHIQKMPRLISRRFSPHVSSQIFMISGLVVRYLIHLELTYLLCKIRANFKMEYRKNILSSTYDKVIIFELIKYSPQSLFHV